MYSKELDSPCRELSNGGLGFAVALPICSGIDFWCACTEEIIQL